jgi:hypothetical protein
MKHYVIATKGVRGFFSYDGDNVKDALTAARQAKYPLDKDTTVTASEIPDKTIDIVNALAEKFKDV